jgi:hypothetical protein
VPGFPIRTPWDHSSVDSSPRPIAASHVLHRLLVPRHPPFALDNLTTKMLASTVQFSTNDQPTTHNAPHQQPQPPPNRRPRSGMRDQAMPGRPTPPHPTGHQRSLRPSERQPTVVPSGPNRVLYIPLQPHQINRSHHHSGCTKSTRPLPNTNSPVSPPSSTPTRHPQAAGSIPAFAGWCSLERR